MTAADRRGDGFAFKQGRRQAKSDLGPGMETGISANADHESKTQSQTPELLCLETDAEAAGHRAVGMHLIVRAKQLLVKQI